MRTLLRAAAIVLLLGCCLAGLARADSPDDTAVHEAVAKRLKALRSIVVEYDVVEAFHPDVTPATAPAKAPAVRLAPGITASARTGTDSSTRRFCFVDGNIRWEQTPSEETIKKQAADHILPITRQIDTYFPGPGLSEQFTLRPDAALGLIQRTTATPQFDDLTLGLGLRQTEFAHRTGWETAQTLAEMEVRREGDYVILARNNALSGDDKRVELEEHVLDPAHAYAQVAFRRHDYLPPFAVWREVRAEQFQTVDDVALPSVIISINKSRDGKITREWKATIRKYQLNDPANVPMRLQIAWPRGTKLLDARTMARFEIKIDGQTLLDDALRHE